MLTLSTFSFRCLSVSGCLSGCLSGCRVGVEGGIVVAKCDNKEWGFGYNAANSEYCDLLKAGVLDPAKVFFFFHVFFMNIVVTRLL